MKPPAHKEPDCTECAHYYITHDVSFPYGCRALDFKSKRKPHLDVLEASHEPCLAFEPRRGMNMSARSSNQSQ